MIKIEYEEKNTKRCVLVLRFVVPDNHEQYEADSTKVPRDVFYKATAEMVNKLTQDEWERLLNERGIVDPKIPREFLVPATKDLLGAK